MPRPQVHRFAVHPASEAERASLRALKNWLFAMPGENPLEDQIVRLRLAAAIATLTARPRKSRPPRSSKTPRPAD